MNILARFAVVAWLLDRRGRGPGRHGPVRLYNEAQSREPRCASSSPPRTRSRACRWPRAAGCARSSAPIATSRACFRPAASRTRRCGRPPCWPATPTRRGATRPTVGGPARVRVADQVVPEQLACPPGARPGTPAVGGPRPHRGAGGDDGDDRGGLPAVPRPVPAPSPAPSAAACARGSRRWPPPKPRPSRRPAAPRRRPVPPPP
jgi:hypothetical protein